MAKLILEEDIARRPDGRLLLVGSFCVSHDDEFDRLILDCRPQNFCESRWLWVRLPLGSHPCKVLLWGSEGIQASGDDLKNLFLSTSPVPSSSV